MSSVFKLVVNEVPMFLLNFMPFLLGALFWLAGWLAVLVAALPGLAGGPLGGIVAGVVYS